jgi:aminopeptidase N
MRLTLVVVLLLFAQVIFSQESDPMWQSGLRCFKDHNYHGTIAYMDSLLTRYPAFADGLYTRGIALTNLGNMKDACSDFTAAELQGDQINKAFIEYQCNPDFLRNLMIKQYYAKQKVYPQYGYRPLYTRADTLRGALRPERTCFDVNFYDLTVRIIPQGKKIKGSNDIYFTVAAPTKKIQIDLFDNYTVSEISWNGKPLTWHREYNALFIDFPEELKKGESHKITIAYQGRPLIAPNPPWDGGFVWSHDKNNNLWLGVACEQLGASSWWPTKDHMTDKPDSMQINIEVPHGYKAVSNGDLKSTKAVDKKYDRFSWFVHYPINNYNATFYVGKYVAFGDTVIDGTDTVKLDYNVLGYSLDTARKHFVQTREVVAFYNKVFGFYPFAKDGFGLVESPYEGMEHQSAIAYGHGFSKNNTNDYRNNIYDYIIVHEGAHEWWGNSVTAADMADIWIHEGFATYAEYLFLEHKLGKDEYYFELADKSQYIFNIWPMVQHRDVNENTFASNDVYNKGAMMLHCLRCTINNDSVFFGLIRGFCVANRYKCITSTDFISFVNQYTGTDYTAFFKKFLYDTRLPLLEYSFTEQNGDLLFRYRWADVEEGFQMPFGIETDKKEAFRFLGTTLWKEERLANTKWFNFFNLWKGYQGAPESSFTYYITANRKP